ncbi:MAG: hypothetical protein AUI36_31415 [Cyanobacteria bacterium 13_1_40CM_2_61_4]|nr:MAG: hypothetical protein AUI36_31415 [Cyanobacteria bacterium 13_1_40CM_2_61_4]
MQLSRRRFLRTGAAGSAALLVPGVLDALLARIAEGARLETRGYGPLLKDPGGLLDLPAGFSYRALSTAVLGSTHDPRFSQLLSNGEPVPALHDGMGAFRGPRDLVVLVRNHEVWPGQGPRVDEARVRPYDRLGTGGTTTLWVDSERKLVRAFPSLSGTFRNCAGGVTPWGSWLSCEECTFMPGPLDPRSYDQTPAVSERHGYVFEVDARAEGLVEPNPIKAMGRFYHEAVAVDPATGFVYLSEDRGDGLLYRYRPNVLTRGLKRPAQLAVGDLAKGGVLEALRIAGMPSALTQNWHSRAFLPGRKWGVDWIAIPNTDPEIDMERDPNDREPDPLKRGGRTAPTSTRAQGFRLGAAQFARTEGILYTKGSVHFCCTDGGEKGAGQVWRLELASQELSLAVEPNDMALLDGPDNLTVAPNGDLLVCEDGKDENFLVGITREGRLYRMAKNACNGSELCGACFSVDRRTLFVNIQNPGTTFAIEGPWGQRA